MPMAIATATAMIMAKIDGDNPTMYDCTRPPLPQASRPRPSPPTAPPQRWHYDVPPTAISFNNDTSITSDVIYVKVK